MHIFKWGPGALMYFAPDGAPSGQAPATETPTPATPAPGGQDPEKATPTPATGQAGKVDELPDWAQGLIKELRSESAAVRKAKADADKAQQAEAEKRLAEDAQWKQLADQRQARLAELEPQATTQAERLAKFEAMLVTQLDAEIKDWPAELKSLDPGKDADLLARFDWLQKSRALAAKLTATTVSPGNGKLPKPAGVGAADAERLAREAQARWSRSQF